MAAIPQDQEHALADKGPPLPPATPLRADGPPPLPPENTDPAVAEVLTLHDSTDHQPDEEMGLVTTVLTSAATVSFFTSATFHLLALGAVVVISPLLGLNWLALIVDPSPPLRASLGDEEILGELPEFAIVGDLSDQLDTPSSTVQQLARELQKSDSAIMMMANDDVVRNILGSDAPDPENNAAGLLLKVPESGLAVTKGSFTAFTIPANPKPREIYAIVIEIRLPDDVKEFRVNDLVGEVRGSDRYTQKLPYDSRAPYAAGYPGENQKIIVLKTSSVLDVVDNRVQIVVKVPGAARLVKDEIRIRSKKLKEEQVLTLVFGVPGPTNSAETPDNPDDTNEKPPDDAS